MLEKAARLALGRYGRFDALLRAIDTVAVVRFTADSSDVRAVCRTACSAIRRCR
jgi:hypothetical protein